MTSNINIALCDVCENFRDVDKLVSEEGFKHHNSYTALCKAASNGCDLCQLFVRQHSELYPEYPELPPNFDENMDATQTQITWTHNGGCLFILTQETLIRTGEFFNLRVEVFTQEDDPLANILSGRPTQITSNSEACFDLVSCWMDKCKTEHLFCPQDSDFALPNRLIDVGSNSREPFLHNPGGQRGQWVTLSHCWGNSVSDKTTIDTIRQRELSIPLEDLQPTFRDAILITRKLGFQYLWIDALCIVQDSPEEWARASTQMHEIYSQGSVNISATAAHSGQDGIFSSADKDRCYMKPFVHLPTYSSSSNIRGSLSIRVMPECGRMMRIKEQPLYRRAWILQESTLSPRRIDFSSEQLHWRCRTVSFQEGNPHVPEIMDRETNLKELFQMPLGAIPPQPDLLIGDDMTPMSWWYHALNLYYRRSLTFAEDNLPAIAGIARQVKERTGYNYKAGLWLEDFHRALLWKPENRAERLKNTSVPSWSWASIKLPWVWSQWSLGLNIYLPGFRATILEVSMHTLEDNPFGPVISGSLRIEGNCSTFESWQPGTNITYNNLPFKTMRMLNRWRNKVVLEETTFRAPPLGSVVCALDESLPSRRREEDYDADTHSELIQRKAICLQIAKFGHDRELYMIKTNEEMATVYALILEPTGRGLDEYKRIGIAEVPEENGLAEGWTRRTLTIV